MKKHWWKALAVVILSYVIMAGLLNDVPRQPILNESIRNLYFHVTMWFAMMVMLLVSMIYAIRYLRKNKALDDDRSVEFANTGIIFGAVGIATGSVWAKFTWGDWWVNDPKLNGAAIGMLIYLAYLILRGSFRDDTQKARISAIYNIFAFAVFMPLVWILPRLTDSLHPGNGGNPGFSSYDLDNRMRMVFYPAVIGFTLLGVWISTLRVRFRKIERTSVDL